MQVNVISSVNEARSDDFLNKTVIVVDVLRATSTIVTALEHGCSGVIPVETVSQARNLLQDNELLGGERFGKKIPGFHFGNSPLEYRTPEILGKKIILTTTNGTRAIQKSLKAMHLLAGSLLNAESCVRAALELKRDIFIICAGTNDEFSLEDGLCAGLMIERMEEICPDRMELNDLAAAMKGAYQHFKGDLLGTLLNCSNGKKLAKMGFKEDIHFCAALNQYTTVPILKDQTLVPMVF